MSNPRITLTDADWAAVEWFAEHGKAHEAARRHGLTPSRFYKALDRIAPALRARTLRFHLKAAA